MKGEVEEEVEEKREESLSELDLRHHLHKPRQTRIQQDVFSVRGG